MGIYFLNTKHQFINEDGDDKDEDDGENDEDDDGHDGDIGYD